MHIVTILAYACLFWRAAGNPPNSDERATSADPLAMVLVILLPAILFGASRTVSLRTLRLLASDQSRSEAQVFFYRAGLGLRALLIGGFAFAVFATPWPELVAVRTVAPWLQIIGDLLVLSVFFAGLIAIWIGTYPVEVAIRSEAQGSMTGAARRRPWAMRSYLDFNVRHHFLVVAAPLTLILCGANVTQGYSRELRIWTGWMLAPDALLAAIAAVVFLVAPEMLRRIWRTSPLPAGELRARLEGLCERIGLRVRDILVWDSDGLMINAAVMGVAPRLRYVLLSDALLATMTPRQIEAVFGHEAGHVHHRHIPHFLVFAVVGWIAAAAVMEAAARAGMGSGASRETWIGIVQGVGIAATLLFWGVGFGWLSQRFERQADMFAAQCAAPEKGECPIPCSVHPDVATDRSVAGLVCSSGAEIFASALDRVAVMSGIPREEFSWRHSSIGSRIRFLSSLAADPGRAISFDRMIRRVKHGMLATAVIGGVAWGYYWLTAVSPALVEIHTTMR